MSRRSAVVNSNQRIRELNDELRQHLLGGLAVMTPVSPHSASKQSNVSFKQYPSLMTFVTPTIRTKNTTLVHSKPRGKRSFSRSTILIRV
jgi:hypothetical protein